MVLKHAEIFKSAEKSCGQKDAVAKRIRPAQPGPGKAADSFQPIEQIMSRITSLSDQPTA